MKYPRTLALTLSVAFLAACGGGGGSSPAPATPVAATDPSTGGTAVPPTASAGVVQNVVAGTTVTLDGSASSADLGRALTYAWTLTSKPTGSSATLVSPTSARPTFTADVAGIYVATVVVNDGKVNSGAASVSITASVANAAPVANAGVAQNVVAGSVVTLDGSASSDANSDPLTYAWTLTAKPAGSSATMVSPTSAKPTFAADVAGTYVATVTVNDGKVDSGAASVSITASVANAAPIANAGVAQNVVAGTVVTLEGSASSDANNDPLTYAWTLTAKPAASSATLASPTSAKPTFTADVAGTYVATVIVNDGKVNSGAATVSITASVANAAPVANAGVAQNVVAGTVVTLDGSASSDANNDPLSYAWTLTAKPAGSSATLASPTSAKPTFTADVAGTYVATVIVNDGKVNSGAAAVSIIASVANAVPVANAGAAQNVVSGQVVFLDGSASTDANGDALTYAWTLISKPSGSPTTLFNTTSVAPSFIAIGAGTYVAALIVNDGKVNSVASIVTISAAVANATPVANAGVAQRVMAGSLVMLDGSASSDANGDPLTYAWTLTTKPTGSTAVLASSNSVTTAFVADVAGTYVARLTVNDGKVSSNAVSVTATALGAPYTNSGSGDTVFDMPADVTRVRIQGTFNGSSSNFIVYIAGRLVVNALLGTSFNAVAFDGTYLLTGGGVVQITNANGVSWSFTEVR